MKQETEPIQRPSKKQEVANMDDALAEMRSLQRVHFFKSLPKTAIQKGEPSIYGKYAELSLPTQFVQENGDKFEEWVILRAQLSRGRVSRPWVVRLRVSNRARVRIGLGWHSFVTGNRLKEGDCLIFLLKEEARSEFEVHLFRGPHGSPHFPDEEENSPTDEGDTEEYFSASEEFETSSGPSLGHPEVEPNKAFMSKIRNGKAAPFSHSKHFEKHHTYPGFHKRLTATSVRGSNGDSNAGHFVFPWSFVKTHGNQLRGSVQLQGIHEDSPTYWVACRGRQQHSLRVHFLPTEWSRFVKENGLKNGHELQFSLVDESYFLVRKV